MQYSLIVPIYNDGNMAEDFCIEFEKEFKHYLNKENIEEDTELIFVNDGSTNNALTTIRNT